MSERVDFVPLRASVDHLHEASEALGNARMALWANGVDLPTKLADLRLIEEEVDRLIANMEAILHTAEVDALYEGRVVAR